ncbi:MAG: hypothetical protein JNJ73_02735 [Hyphomonadaceae bacterium]|nr:hypothetical protein [Hyphomonadaceae bacterium]
MKSRHMGAAAFALALAQLAAAPAYAEQAAAGFRAPAPQTFTAQDLQHYGLDRTAAERAVALQNQGYEIKVLSEAEAQRYQAGITDNQWLLLGILAGVIVIAVAVSD